MSGHSAHGRAINPVSMPEAAGVEHTWVGVDGLRFHCAVAGDGPPLVLLHGWPQHWWCWRHVIPGLAQRHRVICPDLRGMGWSDGGRGDYSWHALAADVVGILDALDIDDFQLVGHDWGLVAGYRTVFNWPDRVRRFVPLGGIHPWSLDGAPLRLWTAPWHIYLIALLGDLASDGLGITKRCLRAWRYAGEFDAHEIHAYMSVMRQPRCLEATRRFDRNVLAHEVPHYAVHFRHLRSRVPTLHLNGEHDPLVRRVPASYRKYADDMRLETAPGCGHYIAEERPEWLLERLDDFLE